MNTPQSGDIHALSGAYAVDAVDDIERAQFERHLATCASCSSEVASLREAAAQIAEVSAQTPPPALRASVLAGIQTVRPLPPLVAPVAEGRPSSRRRFPALVAAAAAFVVIGGVGATVWHPWDTQSSGVSYAKSDLERVQSAGDRQSVTTQVGSASATLTRSKSLDLAVLQTTGMPAPAPGKVYELWLLHDGVEVRAALMPEGGDVTAVLTGNPATAQGAAITVEPAGGSDTPTTLPIATFDFESA